MTNDEINNVRNVIESIFVTSKHAIDDVSTHVVIKRVYDHFRDEIKQSNEQYHNDVDDEFNDIVDEIIDEMIIKYKFER